jgi:P2 family phage contractile tail tube protein
MPKYSARTIKCKLYDKGNGASKFLHDTVTVTFPEIEFLTESFKGAGVNGEIDLPTYGQVGSLVIEVAHNGLSKDTIDLFKLKTQHLECRWASQVLNSSTGGTEIVGKKIIFKGIPKKLGIGSIEPNKAEEASSSFEVTYFKYVIGNTVVIEIDKLNDVLKVNGTDYSSSVRNVL